MENLIYILFISVFVPILLMALLVEKKARLPIAFMLVGIFISVFAAEINGVVQRWLDMQTFEFTITATPITGDAKTAVSMVCFTPLSSLIP